MAFAQRTRLLAARLVRGLRNQASQEKTAQAMTDTDLMDRLQALWVKGDEEMGEDELTGETRYRRIALLVAISDTPGVYPDVRTLLRDMPSPLADPSATIL